MADGWSARRGIASSRPGQLVRQHAAGHESVDNSAWSLMALNNIEAVKADPDGGICVLCMSAIPPAFGEAGGEFPGCPAFTGFPGFKSFTSGSMSCLNCWRQSVIPLSSSTPYELISWHDHATNRSPGEIGTVGLGAAGQWFRTPARTYGAPGLPRMSGAPRLGGQPSDRGSPVLLHSLAVGSNRDPKSRSYYRNKPLRNPVRHGGAELSDVDVEHLFAQSAHARERSLVLKRDFGQNAGVIAAAALGDGGGHAVRCAHGNMPGIGHILDGGVQVEPDLLILDNTGRSFPANSEQWRAQVEVMQLESLEASRRVKGVPLAQLFAMASDLSLWLPRAGTEIVSQAMGYLQVDQNDLSRFLRVHHYNGEEFVSPPLSQAGEPAVVSAGEPDVYAYPVSMSAVDPQQERFSVQGCPPLTGGGAPIPLSEWEGDDWEWLKAGALYHVVEWLDQEAADYTELFAMLRALDAEHRTTYSPRGFPTTSSPNVCLHPATSQEFADAYFDLVQDFHFRKGLERLPFWVDTDEIMPGTRYHKYVCHLPVCEELRSLRMIACALRGATGYHVRFAGLGSRTGDWLRNLSSLVQFRADFAIGCRSCDSCRFSYVREAAVDEESRWSPLEESVLGVAWTAFVCDEWPSPEAGAAAARGYMEQLEQRRNGAQLDGPHGHDEYYGFADSCGGDYGQNFDTAEAAAFNEEALAEVEGGEGWEPGA
jgi:hypothetical protein